MFIPLWVLMLAVVALVIGVIGAAVGWDELFALLLLVGFFVFVAAVFVGAVFLGAVLA